MMTILLPSLHRQIESNCAASPKQDVCGRAYRSASRSRNQPRLRVHPQTGLAPPTAHDAVVRAHRRDVDVDVNPGPCDHRRRSSPRPSFRSFRRTRPATRPRRRKRTSQGRVRYPPPPPNDRGNGSGPPRTGGFGSLIYGEGTAIVVVIFYRRRQRRGRWRCIFLDRRKRRRHDALDHARHPHGPPGGIDPLHCHDLAREEGASILAVTAVAHVATVVPEQAREVERDRRSHGMPARSLELHRRLVEPSPVGLFAYPADAEHPVLPRQAHGRPLAYPPPTTTLPLPSLRSSSAVPSYCPTSSLTIPSIWAGISAFLDHVP